MAKRQKATGTRRRGQPSRRTTRKVNRLNPDALREVQLIEALRHIPREELIRRDGEAHGAACEGACTGVGSSIQIVNGACPTPCDATKFTAADVRDARRKAKENADLNCFFRSMDPDCVCKGDANSYTELERQCYSGFNDEGVEYCVYRIYYKFTGTCGKRAV